MTFYPRIAIIFAITTIIRNINKTLMTPPLNEFNEKFVLCKKYPKVTGGPSKKNIPIIIFLK